MQTISTSEEIGLWFVFEWNQGYQKLMNSTPENATIFSLLNRRTLVYISVLQEINIHKRLQGAVMMPGSPSQREAALLLLRSPQTFVWLNPMVSRSSFHFSAAFNTVRHSHLKRFQCLFWLLGHPSVSTCLLPTWSPPLRLPGGTFSSPPF